MSQRLPFLLNSTVKSNIRHKTLRPRSYATHQEQDPKPTSSSTPLIVSGLLVLGGLVYYTSTRDPTQRKKSPDPSDVTFQQFQKEADQFIEGRHDRSGALNVQDQPASTIMNEKSNLTAHPMVTKKEAYVDPRTLEKQTGHAKPPPPFDGPHNSPASLTKETAKLQALPTTTTTTRKDMGGADAGGHGPAAGVQTRDTVPDEPISVSLSRVSADIKEGAQETWNRTVDEAREIKTKAESEWDYITNKTADEARAAQQAAQDAKHKVQAQVGRASDKAGDAMNKASNKTEDVANKAEDVANRASNKAEDVANRASNKAEDAANKAQGAKDDAKATWNQWTTEASNKAEQVRKDADATWNQWSKDASDAVETAKDETNAELKRWSKEADQAKQDVKQWSTDISNRAQGAMNDADATLNRWSTQATDQVDKAKGDFKQWSDDTDAKINQARDDWNQLASKAGTKAENLMNQARDDWNELSEDAKRKLEKEKQDAKSTTK